MALAHAWCRIAGFLLAAAMLASPVRAQPDERQSQLVTGTLQSPVLTVDSERLFSGSAFGRRVEDGIQADAAELASENRRIEAELAAEERALTERRADMETEAFRAAADAFDARVMRIRREQDAKARALSQREEAARRTFFDAAQPVLEQMMLESGAAVIVERRSVFMSLQVVDITDLAIDRIDDTIAPEIPDPAEAPPTDEETAPAEDVGPGVAPPGGVLQDP